MTARQVEGVQLERAAGELLILVPSTFEAHALNPSAAAVYERCDGRSSKAEMAAAIEHRTGLAASDAVVELALAELCDAGLVVRDAQPAEPVPTRRSLMRRLGLASPAVLPSVETVLVPAAEAGWAAARGQPAAPAGTAGEAAQRRPDVSFVPTSDEAIDEMLALGRVGPNDRIYELGCGDARLLIAAAQCHGCRGIGYDLDALRVAQAQARIRQLGLADRVRVEQRDVFELDLSEADVVMLYLLPAINVRLIPQLQKMKAGSRIVSQDFDMPGVIPDRAVQIYSVQRGIYKTFFLWTVPLRLSDQPVPREWGQSGGIT